MGNTAPFFEGVGSGNLAKEVPQWGLGAKSRKGVWERNSPKGWAQRYVYAVECGYVDAAPTGASHLSR